MSQRMKIGNSRRWVVKVGSALLTKAGAGLDQVFIGQLIDQLAALRQSGAEVVLVSSGAVAAGMHRMGWKTRPHEVFRLQAAAAIGQMGLVQVYESGFQRHGIHTAQVLLTHDDLADRKRYLNARSALRSLLELRIVPVVNENDTVVTDEIQFGDNDTLAALVCNLVEAELLVILTDQDGLYTADPSVHAEAQLVVEAVAGEKELEEMAGPGRGLGRGGMQTKVHAATKAARSGAATVIANGRKENVLQEIRAGNSVGTLLTSSSSRIAARKQWLAGQMQVRGRLTLDEGAVRVLKESGRSLLPVGVTAVIGAFRRGELVVCEAASGQEVARGLVNYSADEAKRIVGHSSDDIEGILGYVAEPELIHRDNMVLA